MSPWWPKMELKKLFHYWQQNHHQWTKKPQIKNFHKTDPPKSGNSDSKYNFEIFKNQNQTKKRPPKVPKKSKTYIRRPQIKKFYKKDPYKGGKSDSKYNFEIFKNQNQTKKDSGKFEKI